MALEREERPLVDWLIDLLPKVLRWAHGRLPRSARRHLETADLVQDAAAGAISTLGADTRATAGRLMRYLQVSIRNRILNEVRRAALLEMAPIEDPPDHRSTPLENALASEKREVYRRALASLRIEDQMLIVGRADLGASYRTLAFATGRPSAEAARVATYRALAALARAIDDISTRPVRLRGLLEPRAVRPTDTNSDPARHRIRASS
jgi:RNA polymerase sigma-70 factor (ECF subfamily)